MERPTPSDAFTRDVESVSVSTLEFTADREVISELRSSLDMSGFLLLGEVHGVRENPSIIRTILDTFDIKRLALEWDPTLGDITAQYIKSGNLHSGTLQNRDDGRFTSGHLALIRELIHTDRLNDLICIDLHEPESNWQDRDCIMAQEAIKAIGDPILIVAGNLHTRLTDLCLDDEFPHFKPMGSFIKEKYPGIKTLNIDYGSGSYTNIGLHDFDDNRSSDTPMIRKTGQDTFSFYIPTAHPAVVPA